MPREIRFRGKRIDNGEWVEGDLISRYGRCWVVEASNTTALRSCTTHCADKYDWRSVEVDPATVGQYIGFPDKNSTGIFEGDIVRCWGGECYQGQWEFDRTITVNDSMDDYPMLCNIEYIEVIDNRWDNLSLLGGQPNAK